MRRERERVLITNYLFIMCALLMQISSRHAFRGSVPGVWHITEDDGGGGLGYVYHYHFITTITTLSCSSWNPDSE